jgi:hypothetical protein
MASNNSVETVGTVGRPWTVVATFNEYGPAHSRAEQLRASGDVQVKVLRIAAGYTVRTRKPETSTVISENTSSKQSKTRVKAKDRRVNESDSE